MQYPFFHQNPTRAIYHTPGTIGAQSKKSSAGSTGTFEPPIVEVYFYTSLDCSGLHATLSNVLLPRILNS